MEYRLHGNVLEQLPFFEKKKKIQKDVTADMGPV
jgi:hypothetical protein